MSKHITPEVFYDLPSGNRVYPSRLIHRDGSIMWKHALCTNNDVLHLPVTQAHESHIIKTAQRLEELLGISNVRTLGVLAAYTLVLYKS